MQRSGFSTPVIPGWSQSKQHQRNIEGTSYEESLTNLANGSADLVEYVHNAMESMLSTGKMNFNPREISSRFRGMTESRVQLSRGAANLKKADSKVEQAEGNLDKTVGEARSFNERMEDMWDEHPIKTIVMSVFVFPMLFKMMSDALGALKDEIKVGLAQDKLTRAIDRQQRANNGFIEKRQQLLQGYLVSVAGPTHGPQIYNAIQVDIQRRSNEEPNNRTVHGLSDIVKDLGQLGLSQKTINQISQIERSVIATKDVTKSIVPIHNNTTIPTQRSQTQKQENHPEKPIEYKPQTPLQRPDSRQADTIQSPKKVSHESSEMDALKSEIDALKKSLSKSIVNIDNQKPQVSTPTTTPKPNTPKSVQETAL